MQSCSSGSCVDPLQMMGHRFVGENAASLISKSTKGHKQRRFPILCIFLFLLGGWTVSCGSPVERGPQLTVRPIKELEPNAIAEARKWKPDAYLSRVDVNAIIAGSQAPSRYGDLLNFDFRSRSDSESNFVVDIGLDGRTQATRGFVGNPYLDWVPIEPADWTVDSSDAWRIAQEHGGSELLSRYSSAASHVTLTLERQNPPRSGPVLWRVAYSIPNDTLFVLIDPKTGAIVSTDMK